MHSPEIVDKDDYKQFIKNIGLSNKTKDDIVKIDSPDTNYFNKAVLKQVQQVGASVFHGLSIEPYLTQLYNHWKKYFQ